MSKKKDEINGTQITSIVFNSIIIILAAILACLSASALVTPNSYLLEIVGLQPRNESLTFLLCIATSLLLVVSSVLSFITIFALGDVKWLQVYLVLSIAPFVINIINIVYLFGSFQELQYTLGHEWPVRVNSLLSQYALNDKFTGQFDELQTTGKCCGITNHFDYIQTAWSEMSENEMIMVPDSCCHIDRSFAPQRSLDKCRNGESHIYSEGCHAKVEQSIELSKADIKLMMQLLIALIILHVSCIVLAYCNWRVKRDCRNVPKTVIVRL